MSVKVKSYQEFKYVIVPTSPFDLRFPFLVQITIPVADATPERYLEFRHLQIRNLALVIQTSRPAATGIWEVHFEARATAQVEHLVKDIIDFRLKEPEKIPAADIIPSGDEGMASDVKSE